jgi:hypothetical protein
MSPRPIGEIFATIVTRCERLMWLHHALQSCPDSSSKKSYLMGAFSCDQIDGDDLTLMIQAYGLETA